MSYLNPLARDLDHVLEHTEDLWKGVRGARFFITGGTGFVGTWLTESLVWANRRLDLGISATLVTRDAARFEARSPHLARDGAVRLLVTDAAAIGFPKLRADFVVHAATSNVDAENPAASFDRDIAATRHALELAAHNPGCRLLFTSSGAVYGAQPPALRRIPETYAGAPSTTDLATSYGQAKRVSEFLCASYSQLHKFDAVIARLFAFLGPYLPLDEHYAAGNFMRDALAGGPVRVTGDGTPYRSYLYAADMATWLWTALFRGESRTAYNVGSPDEISIYDLARRIGVAGGLGARAVNVRQAATAGKPASRYVPCTKRAQEALGVRIWVPLDEAIQRTFEWHTRASAPALVRVCA